MREQPKKLSPEVLAKLKAEKAKRDAEKAAEEISVPAAQMPEFTTEPPQEVVPEPTPEPIPETIDQREDAKEEMSPEEFDDLYLQALKKLKECKTLDLSILQRILKINYKTASRILDKIFYAGLTENFGDLIRGKKAELDRIITEIENKGRTEPADVEEEALEQPSTPEAPTAGSNEEKLAALDETIKNAEEKIRALNLELAEAMRVEKSDVEESLEKDLEKLKGELDENRTKLAGVDRSWGRKLTFGLFFNKDKEYKQKIKALEEEIKEKERLLGLEKYKKENPFKYSLVEKMAEKNRKIIFGEKPTFEEINRQLKTDGEEISHGWTSPKIHISKDYLSDLSPNGFYIKVSNPEKITDPKGAKYNVLTQNKEITYDLIRPGGETFSRNLSHQNAVSALVKEAKLYQERQRTLFEDEKEIKELQSIVGRDAKKEFLERKRMERIRNIEQVKRSIDSYTRLIEGEGDNSYYIRQLNFLNDEPLKYFEENLASNRRYGGQRLIDENMHAIQQIKDTNTRYDNLIASL